MRRVRWIAVPLGLAAALVATPALADEPADAGAEKVWASCAERIPDGATRPKLDEVFAERGLSGYAAYLVVTVTHGKGETVLPEGFKVQAGGDAAKALAEAAFVIPEADAGALLSISTTPKEDGAVTKLQIPFVPLPKTPGRNEMILPPVPVAIARANGDIVTVCTQPHTILVEDPIANDPDPKVRPNPPPRPQREDWALARQLTIGLVIGAVLGAILAYAIVRWRRRPKFVPPPPPRLPWEVALEELDELRRSSLLTEGRNDQYFDRVSDCVRKYLGARYGFDGLETTTDEMRSLLKRVRPPVPELKKIGAFLSDCDLVKFARVVPVESDCLDLLRRGERIVRVTIPPQKKASPDPASPEPPAEEASP